MHCLFQRGWIHTLTISHSVASMILLSKISLLWKLITQHVCLINMHIQTFDQVVERANICLIRLCQYSASPCAMSKKTRAQLRLLQHSSLATPKIVEEYDKQPCDPNYTKDLMSQKISQRHKHQARPIKHSKLQWPHSASQRSPCRAFVDRCDLLKNYTGGREFERCGVRSGTTGGVLDCATGSNLAL